MRFTCEGCGALNDVPELEHSIRFPDDLKKIMDLLEGRLNCVQCLACKKTTVLLTYVAVLDVDGKTILLTGPEGVAWGQDHLAIAAKAGLHLEKVADYEALRLKVIERLNRYLTPVVPVILPEQGKPLTRAECIKRVSPFVLRLFKSRLDGYLPPLVQLSGDPSPETRARIDRDLYVQLVSDQLQRILMEAARQSKVTALLEEVEKLVPKECLTAEVLEAVKTKCRDGVPPYEHPREFSDAFIQELLNAVTHAYAGKMNPRGKQMAVFLISVWILSRRPSVELDPQFLLSPCIVRQVVLFEDLWDMWIAGEKKLTKERLDEISEMMKHYGLSERFLETLRGRVVRMGQRIDGKPIDATKFAIGYEKVLLEKMSFNSSHAESKGYGHLLGGSIRHLLLNGQEEVAQILAKRLVSRAKEANDEVATVSMAAHAADELNNFYAHDLALEMIAEIFEGETKRETWGPDLFIYVFTVVGNTMRYTFYYQKALDAYHLALRFVDTVPDKSRQDEDREVLEKNIGIVYRQMGRYNEALPLLRKAAERDPQDHNHQHGLAILYEEVNRPAEAIRYVDRAIELAHGPIDAPVRGTYLLSRAILRRSLGDMDKGLEDLAAALEILPTDRMKLRAAAATLGFEPSTQKGKEFVERCRKMAIQHVQQGSSPELGLEILVYGQLAEYFLRSGRPGDAKALLEQFSDKHNEMLEDAPWQFDFVMARACYACGRDQVAWEHVRRAWQALEEEVPRAEEAEFAISWMQDKDQVQRTLASIACEAVRHDAISAQVLPAVYDFSNGREMNARLAHVKEPEWDAPEELLLRYGEIASKLKRNVESFFFLECEDTVHMAHMSSRDSKVSVIGNLEIPTKRLTEIRNRFRIALRTANPADVGDLEHEIEGWSELEARISSLVVERAAGDAHVLFLPGRACTGLPLHLIRANNGKCLIEERTVAFAPNFRTLLRRPQLEAKAGRTGFVVVCVTAQKDGARFRRRALDAAGNLVNLIKQWHGVKRLEEGAADHAAIGEAMGTAKEIVFLCHGTSAGLDGGYGICIADRGDLPPRVLSVEEFPDQAKFILSWHDIEKSPEVVVAIACSSGVTEVGGGGVRFGLEQSLFASGTDTIISPLWDVEQRSALDWVESFYKNRFEHPDWTLEEAYQRTCLAMQAHYGHFYFWAPFIMNVSAMVGPEEAA
jgi:tetratricopeptide (TPR) repeat protein